MSGVARFWMFHRLQATMFSLAGLWGFSSLLGFRPEPADWLIVPLLATHAYQLNRLSDLEEDRVNDPADALAAHRSRHVILGIVLSCAAGALFLGFQTANAGGLAIIAILLALGIAYSIPLFGSPRRRIKDVLGAKNLAPAAGIALTVCLYPAVNAGLAFSFEMAACLSALFTGSVLLEILCDVRDRDGDRAAGVNTLPVVLGPGRTRIIVNALNAGSALLLAAAVLFGILPAIWTLFLANSAMVALAANPLYDQLASSRPITYGLIFLQILLAVLLGLIA